MAPGPTPSAETGLTAELYQDDQWQRENHSLAHVRRQDTFKPDQGGEYESPAKDAHIQHHLQCLIEITASKHGYTFSIAGRECASKSKLQCAYWPGREHRFRLLDWGVLPIWERRRRLSARFQHKGEAQSGQHSHESRCGEHRQRVRCHLVASGRRIDGFYLVAADFLDQVDVLQSLRDGFQGLPGQIDVSAERFILHLIRGHLLGCGLFVLKELGK